MNSSKATQPSFSMSVTVGMWMRMRKHRVAGVSMRKLVAHVIEALDLDKLLAKVPRKPSGEPDWSILNSTQKHDKVVPLVMSIEHRAKLDQLKAAGVPLAPMLRFELMPYLALDPVILLERKPDFMLKTQRIRGEAYQKRATKREQRANARAATIREAEREIADKLGITWEEFDRKRAVLPSNEEFPMRGLRSEQPSRKLRSRRRREMLERIRAQTPVPQGYLSPEQAADVDPATLPRDPDWRPPPAESAETLAQRRLKSLLAGQGDPLDPKHPANRPVQDFLRTLETLPAKNRFDLCAMIGHPDLFTTAEIASHIRAAGYDPGKNKGDRIRARMLEILGPRSVAGVVTPELARRLEIDHEFNVAAGLIPPEPPPLDLDNLYKRRLQTDSDASKDDPEFEVDPFEGIPD